MRKQNYEEEIVIDNKQTEKCWVTGIYTDDCFCDFCDHKEECSGYEDHDENNIV